MWGYLSHRFYFRQGWFSNRSLIGRSPIDRQPRTAPSGDIFENMSKTHVPCDPSFTDAECTRWANLMKKTEKFTDDDYNRTVTKIMDTVPNETVEENFIFIENVTLPDS